MVGLICKVVYCYILWAGLICNGLHSHCKPYSSGVMFLTLLFEMRSVSDFGLKLCILDYEVAQVPQPFYSLNFQELFSVTYSENSLLWVFTLVPQRQKFSHKLLIRQVSRSVEGNLRRLKEKTKTFSWGEKSWFMFKNSGNFSGFCAGVKSIIWEDKFKPLSCMHQTLKVSYFTRVICPHLHCLRCLTGKYSCCDEHVWSRN